MQQPSYSNNNQQLQQTGIGSYQQQQQHQYQQQQQQQQQQTFPSSTMNNNSSTVYAPPVPHHACGPIDDGEKRPSLESLRSQGGYITNSSFSPMGESFSSNTPAASSVFGGGDSHVRRTGSIPPHPSVSSARVQTLGRGIGGGSNSSSCMHSPTIVSMLPSSNLLPIGFQGNPSGVPSNRVFLEKPAVATLCHILETRWKMPAAGNGSAGSSGTNEATATTNDNSSSEQSVVQRLPVAAGQLPATPERMDQPFSLFSFRSMFRVKGQQVTEDVPVEWSDYGCVYHCTFQAEINLKEYVERLVKYFKCAPQCYPVAIALLDRFVANTQVAVDSRNVLRLFLCALLAAAKSREEKYMTTSYYAHIGGITPFELRSLELHFLFSLRWELQVSENAYNAIAQSIALSSIIPRGITATNVLASGCTSPLGLGSSYGTLNLATGGAVGIGANGSGDSQSPMAASFQSFMSNGSTPSQLRVGTPMATVCSPPSASGRETPVRYLAGTPQVLQGGGPGSAGNNSNTRILQQSRQLASAAAATSQQLQQGQQQGQGGGGGPMPMNMFQSSAALGSGGNASPNVNAHLNFSSSGGGGIGNCLGSGSGGGSGYASLGYMGMAGGGGLVGGGISGAGSSNASPQHNYFAATAHSSQSSNNGGTFFLPAVPPPQPPHPTTSSSGTNLSQQQQQQLQHFYQTHHYHQNSHVNRNTGGGGGATGVVPSSSSLPGAVAGSPMPQYHQTHVHGNTTTPAATSYQQQQTHILNIGEGGQMAQPPLAAQPTTAGSGYPQQQQTQHQSFSTASGAGENLCLQPLPSTSSSGATHGGGDSGALASASVPPQSGKRHVRRHSQ